MQKIRFLLFLILCFSFFVSLFEPSLASLLTAQESFSLSFRVISKDSFIVIKEEAIAPFNTEMTNDTQNSEEDDSGKYSNLSNTVDALSIPEIHTLNQEFNKESSTEKTEPDNDFDIEIKRRIFFKDAGNVPRLSISVKNNGFSSVYIFVVLDTNSVMNISSAGVAASIVDGVDINEEDWVKLQDNIYYYGDGEYLWDFYEGCESKLFETQLKEGNPEISIYTHHI